MTPKTIGIIGGGQLGQMLCHAANSMGFKTAIYSNIADAPAITASNYCEIADYLNQEVLEKFAKNCDIITFEFENIPVETVKHLAKKVEIHPSPEILKIAQNRLLEKSFINSIGVKTADFIEIKNFQELEGGLKKFKKAILKTVTMGYDGKGQFVLKNINDAKAAWKKVEKNNLLKLGLILEKFCPFNSEISVIVARTKEDKVKTYSALSNIHKNGILDKSIYPPKISDELNKKAQKIAQKIAKELGLVGVLAIEFFVTNNSILVNEIAPRPHNSGHFSMDGAITSQFQQHIRAIANLPLGSTKFHSTGYMQNIIGEDVNKIAKFYKNENAKIHLYCKTEAKKGRKMGHVNILDKKL